MKGKRVQCCFIISPFGADIQQLRKLLKNEGIMPLEEFIMPSSRITAVSAVKSKIKKADFVLAFISLEKLQPNPLFEIGLAYGLGKPVFLVIQGEGPLPVDLANFAYVRASVDSFDTMSFSLHQFIKKLQSMEEPGYLALPHRLKMRKYSAQGSAPVRSEASFETAQDAGLTNILAMLKGSETLFERGNGSELTTYLINILKAEGVGVSQDDKHAEKGVDLALWIDSLESSFGNPILVEIKIGHLTETQLKNAESQLRRYLEITNSRSGLLLYMDQELKHFRPAILGVPLIIRLDIRQLINELRSKSLATVLLSERNAMIHQGE